MQQSAANLQFKFTKSSINPKIQIHQVLNQSKKSPIRKSAIHQRRSVAAALTNASVNTLPDDPDGGSTPRIVVIVGARSLSAT
jgi:hypothetical protein